MKYILVLGDGMADLVVPGGKTPLEAANKPNIDALACSGRLGLVKTIPDGFSPGSDTANLSVLGYSPKKYYTGRSPLEAVSLGIDLGDGDLAFRANLVTLSEDEPFENKTMVDYSAGEISSAEAKELIAAVDEKLGGGAFKFYAGKSYRHIMVAKNGIEGGILTPPHDISGQKITNYLPKGVYREEFLRLYAEANAVLENHPINEARRRRGLNPANCIWLWGEGRRPKLDSFWEKYGKRGAMISAVDLLKGIGRAAGMTVLEVEGATGTLDTNFSGKAEAALSALNDHDFVYIHIEAPDECGHHGDFFGKTKAIEKIDSEIVAKIVKSLSGRGEDFSLLILPDHTTPIQRMTHGSEAVPYLMWSSKQKLGSFPRYDEITAASSGVFVNAGELLPAFFALV